MALLHVETLTTQSAGYERRELSLYWRSVPAENLTGTSKGKLIAAIATRRGSRERFAESEVAVLSHPEERRRCPVRPNHSFNPDPLRQAL